MVVLETEEVDTRHVVKAARPLEANTLEITEGDILEGDELGN
jgi:hypothetical protein